MTVQPPVVCLCGSMRFEEEMRLAAVELSVEGRIVVMPHVNMKRPVPANVAAGRDLKTDLDALHFAKIDLADEVLVVCPEGYIGDSTRNEVAYAEKQGKRVGYWYGPEGVCPERVGAHCTHYQEGDDACCACEKQLSS